jgi:hypothetical protein
MTCINCGKILNADSPDICDCCGTVNIRKRESDLITISKKEYDELIKDRNKLSALKSAGVDNWEGYDTALDILEEMEKKK